jgi:hypothetical protein
MNEEYKPEIIVENHKGFSVRKSKKGFLAFKISGGRDLGSRPTIEEAIASIDQYLEQERQAEITRAEQAEELAKERAEEVELARQKLETVLAVIQPIRDFVAAHSVATLKDCVEQLDWEERDRNVPANWEELVEIADKIADKRIEYDSGMWRTDVGEVEVTQYGVVEHSHWDQEENDYLVSEEYELQEYIDAFKEDYLEEEDED